MRRRLALLLVMQIAITHCMVLPTRVAWASIMQDGLFELVNGTNCTVTVGSPPIVPDMDPQDAVIVSSATGRDFAFWCDPGAIHGGTYTFCVLKHT